MDTYMWIMVGVIIGVLLIVRLLLSGRKKNFLNSVKLSGQPISQQSTKNKGVHRQRKQLTEAEKEQIRLKIQQYQSEQHNRLASNLRSEGSYAFISGNGGNGNGGNGNGGNGGGGNGGGGNGGGGGGNGGE